MALTITNLGTASEAAGVGSLSVTAGVGGVTAGDVIFVAVTETSATEGPGGSVADDVGNVYSSIQSANLNNTTSAGFGNTFYAQNVTAGVTAITYTKADGTGFAAASVTACLISGGLDTNPLDTGVTNKATGLSATPSVTSGAPAGINEMFVAAFSVEGGSGLVVTQDTGHGWATPPNQVGTTFDGQVAGGSLFNAGTGAKVYSPTLNVSAQYAAFVCAFKMAPVIQVVGRTPPKVFQPPSGPTRGLKPTLAYPPPPPPSSDDVTPPAGRTPPRIFRPKAGPTRGLTPTWAYPPAIITPPVGRTPPRVFRPRAGPTRGLTPTWAFPSADVITPPQVDEPPYSHPGRDPFVAILAWRPGAPMPVLSGQLSPAIPGQSVDDPPFTFSEREASTDSQIVDAWAVRWYGWEDRGQPLDARKNSSAIPGQSVDQPPFAHSERSTLIDTITDAWQVRWYPWTDRTQPLEARKLSPGIPGQSADNPPVVHHGRDVAQLAGIAVAWIAPPPAPILPKQNAPGVPGASVDNPPFPGALPLDFVPIYVVAWLPAPPMPVLPKQNAAGVPGQSVDQPQPRSPKEPPLWWVLPPLPTLAGKLAAGIPGQSVDAPPTRQQAGISDAVLQTWRPPDPAPTQRGPVGPGIPGRSVDQPIPTNIAVFPAILVSWIPPPPAPVLAKQNSPAIPGQSVDQPIPRTSKEPPLWWEAARLPILPLVPLTFTPQDNPPFDQRESPFFAILVAWRPAPPAPVLPPPVPPPSGAVVVTQPFRFDAGLVALLFPRDPIIIQPRRTYPLGQPEDQPPPQRRLDVRWPAIDPAPILPRQLSPGIPGVSVDPPPPLARRVDVAVAWRPADPAPTLPRQLSPGIPGLSADDPPRLRREALRLDLPFVLPQSPAHGVPTSAIFAPVGWPWLGAVLRAWVPVPGLPELGQRFVVQPGRVDQPPPSTLRTALASILVAWLPPPPMPILPKKAGATGGNVSPMAAAARIIVSGYRARLFSSGLRVRLLAHPPRRVRTLGLAATLGRLRVLISRRRIRKSVFRR